ncbi:MAG: hypothetical protein H6739_07855 [Alphaproteobacteria bacterium]|nr:hypothetical protein [Alphaproteobacteria bacterium]
MSRKKAKTPTKPPKGAVKIKQHWRKRLPPRDEAGKFRKKRQQSLWK